MMDCDCGGSRTSRSGSVPTHEIVSVPKGTSLRLGNAPLKPKCGLSGPLPFQVIASGKPRGGLVRLVPLSAPLSGAHPLSRRGATDLHMADRENRRDTG
jgi:hypothetical protein